MITKDVAAARGCPAFGDGFCQYLFVSLSYADNPNLSEITQILLRPAAAAGRLRLQWPVATVNTVAVPGVLFVPGKVYRHRTLPEFVFNIKCFRLAVGETCQSYAAYPMTHDELS